MDTRKPLRLSHYDYASYGIYFITICAARRGRTFGHLDGDTVCLNAAGRVVASHLEHRIDQLEGVSMDARIVMPDHIHALVLLLGRGRSLGSVVAAFKAGTTREIGRSVPYFRRPVWQRGYYDHVVRDEEDLDRIREYVVTNPVRGAAR